MYSLTIDRVKKVKEPSSFCLQLSLNHPNRQFLLSLTVIMEYDFQIWFLTENIYLQDTRVYSR